MSGLEVLLVLCVVVNAIATTYAIGKIVQMEQNLEHMREEIIFDVTKGLTWFIKVNTRKEMVQEMVEKDLRTLIRSELADT